MTRVLIVDDQRLVRSGFRMMLEAAGGIDVVGEAADGLEAVKQARALQPDVVIMDIRMPAMDGIEATRQIMAAPPGRRPRVLMLTTFGVDEYVYDALRAGASGFLLKDAPPAELVDAVHVVARGDALLAPSITRRLIELHVTGSPARSSAAGDEAGEMQRRLDDLTEREREVLELIAAGHSNAEIAARLFLSEATVKSHVTRLLSKLGVRDRVQAVVFAYEAGVVAPGRSRMQ